MNDVACRFCGSGRRGAPVVVVTVFAAGGDAYPLIPDEEYRVCECDRAWVEFVARAIASHPTTREWDWTEAIITCRDKRTRMALRPGAVARVGLA